MLRGKERKNGFVQLEVDEEHLCTLKINCKGERTVRKANKGIIVEKKYNRFLKIKKKRKIPQNCTSPA